MEGGQRVAGDGGRRPGVLPAHGSRAGRAHLHAVVRVAAAAVPHAGGAQLDVPAQPGAAVSGNLPQPIAITPGGVAGCAVDDAEGGVAAAQARGPSASLSPLYKVHSCGGGLCPILCLLSPPPQLFSTHCVPASVSRIREGLALVSWVKGDRIT